ncbi:MAG: hypothetical protein KF760_24445 [Candidatus Eremiobacteraeota bacterium]|nr:hypothetical protein [Candidatus Eremiobacteraeota bacterium]MCW5867530.1 hypothetical protein [Candidatus Eremiobacteraeota bacterium]
MLGSVEIKNVKMRRAAEFSLTYGEFTDPARVSSSTMTKNRDRAAWLHNSTACMRFRARQIPETRALAMLYQAI